MINKVPQRTTVFAHSDIRWANEECLSCVHHAFELHARSEPAGTALKCGSALLSYRELNENANQLAHHLIRKGVKAGDLIGVFLERSPELVTAVLAILKAGAAYVPHDPTYPSERIAGAFQSVNQRYVLTASSLVSRIPSSDVQQHIVLDRESDALSCEDRANPVVDIAGDDLAYVVFTSGSTGSPRATAVHHAGWWNLLKWFSAEFSIAQHDKVLVVSSFGFDITQRAIAMPLVTGAQLHLLASNYFSPDLVLASIRADEITLMSCAPSPFYTLFENRTPANLYDLRSLRVVFLGGEAISGSRLKPWHDSPHCRAELVNVYGVAECSDVSTFYRLSDFSHYFNNSVPIGKPILETRIHLLNDAREPVVDGSVGEICITGPGVGKGYLNDPELTAQKFICAKCVNESGRLYRTGDLGRWRADGVLEFVGRVDHQIKLHGVRIELEEIEAVLRQHQGVQEAVALVKNLSREDPRLVAYILPDSGFNAEQWPGLVERLRQHLRVRLPQNMTPHIFVRLTEVPLNPNGKTDRQLLGARDIEVDTPTTNARSRTSLEVAVGAFVAEALNVPSVDFDSDFFDLGGHSLMAIQVVTRINEVFDAQFDLSLFSGERTTVSTLSARVSADLKRTAAN